MRLALRYRHDINALVGVLAGLSLMGGASLPGASPTLVWNASASAPVGLYLMASTPARRGDLALVRTPSSVRDLAARRGYLPANVPMVKRIAAGPGDFVCAQGSRIFVNRIQVATRLAWDSARRPLPSWSGCRRLADDDVFLLMAHVPNSFDGRYFGPVARASIIGKLVPIWTG
jgi:conjugative transfer signal peptidase TraF